MYVHSIIRKEEAFKVKENPIACQTPTSSRFVIDDKEKVTIQKQHYFSKISSQTKNKKS